MSILTAIVCVVGGFAFGFAIGGQHASRSIRSQVVTSHNLTPEDVERLRGVIRKIRGEGA